MTIDPITGMTLVKNIADATRRLYEVAKELKDRETKQKLDEVLDELRDLKQQALELEDDNRELREKLRLKGDEFEFRNPYWYEKSNPTQPLCPKCFSTFKASPMGNLTDTFGRRYCLVCDTAFSE